MQNSKSHHHYLGLDPVFVYLAWFLLEDGIIHAMLFKFKFNLYDSVHFTWWTSGTQNVREATAK